MAIGKKKISIDFGAKQYALLKEFTIENGVSNSKLVNDLIPLLEVSAEVRSSIADICMEKAGDLRKQKFDEKGFVRDEMGTRALQYKSLADILLIGVPENKKPKAYFLWDSMTQMYIKGGYAVFPKDWYVIEDVFAPTDECNFAYVVECRDRYGKYGNIPHYIIFGKVPATELTPDMESKIYDACAKAYPQMRKLLNEWKRVEASFKDPSNLTEEERDRWDRAPIFGIFSLVVKGDPAFWTTWDPDYEPPYGAMIVRTEKTEEKL